MSPTLPTSSESRVWAFEPYTLTLKTHTDKMKSLIVVNGLEFRVSPKL